MTRVLVVDDEPQILRALRIVLREAGFAHREIALALGTTTGSVGTVLARALPRLAAALRAAVPGGAEAL